jgi:hypothetical protein
VTEELLLRKNQNFFLFFQKKSISIEEAVRARLDAFRVSGDDDSEEAHADGEIDKEEADPISDLSFEEGPTQTEQYYGSKKTGGKKLCIACGRKGHQWVTCRVRSVERILAYCGVLDLPDDYSDPRLKEEAPNDTTQGSTLPPPLKSQPKQSAGKLIVPPATIAISSSVKTLQKDGANSRKAAAAKRAREDPNRKCCGCEQDFYYLTERDYNWRLYGAKCGVCAKFCCDECEKQGTADTCCSKKQKK